MNNVFNLEMSVRRDSFHIKEKKNLYIDPLTWSLLLMGRISFFFKICHRLLVYYDSVYR